MFLKGYLNFFKIRIIKRIVFLNINIYYKVMLVKIVGYGLKIDKCINRID